MVAIETHYLGPTNTRGTRYVASASGQHKVTLNCDYTLKEDENHARAAKALRNKMNWGEHGVMFGGWTNRGMVWVFVKGSKQLP